MERWRPNKYPGGGSSEEKKLSPGGAAGSRIEQPSFCPVDNPAEGCRKAWKSRNVGGKNDVPAFLLPFYISHLLSAFDSMSAGEDR
jgi:hypothetical protein